MYVYLPNELESQQTQIQLSKIIFDKIGALDFAKITDFKSGIQVKSCYLNQKFFLLKLCFYGSQPSKDNVFN